MPSTTDPHPNRRPGSAALLFAMPSILVLIATSIWFWFQAPDRVPSHFGPNGQPDDWSSKSETMAILAPLGLGIAVLFSVRWIYEKPPIGVINIPQKEYWLQHGQRDYLFDCLMEFLRITGGALPSTRVSSASSWSSCNGDIQQKEPGDVTHADD